MDFTFFWYLQQEAESPDTDNGKDQDDIIEEELMQLSSSNPALRAASGELSKLQDKVAALERELNGERQRYESVSTQLTVLQQQIRRYCLVQSHVLQIRMILWYNFNPPCFENNHESVLLH